MIKQKPEILSGKSWSGLSPIDKIYKIHNELKEAQDDSFETSVVDALQRIKQGMSYEEWLDSTSMGPAVKSMESAFAGITSSFTNNLRPSAIG